MLYLNEFILVGNLCRDIELKQTANGVPAASFCLAVRREYKPQGAAEAQTDFLPVVAWRQSAEFAAKYFRRGSGMCVRGHVESRKYKDNSGTDRTAFDFVADKIRFVDSATAKGSPTSAAASREDSAANYTEVTSEDDLPF